MPKFQVTMFDKRDEVVFKGVMDADEVRLDAGEKALQVGYPLPEPLANAYEGHGELRAEWEKV